MSAERIGEQMGDYSYDVERLRRELAEYGDPKASRDEPSLQALMGELIQLTRTDPHNGSRVLENTTASGAAEREDHSIERAAAHFRPDVERVSPGAVAQASSHAEYAQQGAVAAQPGSTNGVFSARWWAVVCASILILMATVAGGFFLFWRNGPQTTVAIPIKLEPPSRSDHPSGPAPIRPDVSEPPAAAERTETAVAAPVESMPQPVTSTEGAAPATGEAAAEVSKPPEPVPTTTKPASQKAKKKSKSRRRAPGPTRPY